MSVFIRAYLWWRRVVGSVVSFFFMTEASGVVIGQHIWGAYMAWLWVCFWSPSFSGHVSTTGDKRLIGARSRNLYTPELLKARPRSPFFRHPFLLKSVFPPPHCTPGTHPTCISIIITIHVYKTTLWQHLHPFISTLHFCHFSKILKVTIQSCLPYTNMTANSGNLPTSCFMSSVELNLKFWTMVLCFPVIVYCLSFCVCLTVATVKRFSFMKIADIAALELKPRALWQNQV